MAKKQSPIDIMNLMAGAAHSKAQPEKEPDADDMPSKPLKKGAKPDSAMNAKKKGNEKAPKLS